MRVIVPPKRHSSASAQRRRRFIWVIAMAGLVGVGLLIALRNTHSSSSTTSEPSNKPQTSASSANAKTVPAPKDISSQLQSTVDTWVAQHGTGYRVSVEMLGGVAGKASYKTDTITVPASTYKLFVAYAAYHQAEKGKLALSQTLSNGKTIEQCIEQAIVRSDNVCAEAVGFYIGWDTVNELSRAAGFTHTDINNYGANREYTGDKSTTASDLALLLSKLHEGYLMSKTNSDTLLGYMKRQVYRNGIPAGVGTAPVADKVGFLDTITSDAAIVYAPGSPYVLVILSTTGNNWANIKSLAAEIQRVVENS